MNKMKSLKARDVSDDLINGKENVLGQRCQCPFTFELKSDCMLYA